MKRTAIILLTAIYLLSCTGMGINRFYCCGKLASVSVIIGTADSNAQKANNKDDCCRTEKHNFKVKDSHFSTASFSLAPLQAALLPLFTKPSGEPLTALNTTNAAYRGNGSPGRVAVHLYTLNCTYRI